MIKVGNLRSVEFERKRYYNTNCGKLQSSFKKNTYRAAIMFLYKILLKSKILYPTKKLLYSCIAILKAEVVKQRKL